MISLRCLTFFTIFHDFSPVAIFCVFRLPATVSSLSILIFSVTGAEQTGGPAGRFGLLAVHRQLAGRAPQPAAAGDRPEEGERGGEPEPAAAPQLGQAGVREQQSVRSNGYTRR